MRCLAQRSATQVLELSNCAQHWADHRHPRLQQHAQTQQQRQIERTSTYEGRLGEKFGVTQNVDKEQQTEGMDLSENKWLDTQQ